MIYMWDQMFFVSAAVFQNFKTTHNDYGVDICYCISAPGLSRDVFFIEK